MKVFASSDLQRSPAEVQKAALMEPVFLSYHDEPRYVMMSLEEYVRLKGAEIVTTPESFPKSVLERIREIADSHPEIEVEIAGGLVIDRAVRDLPRLQTSISTPRTGLVFRYDFRRYSKFRLPHLLGELWM